MGEGIEELPPIADLLETARCELNSQIRPKLAAEERYVAAMVARAMQIAARELALGALMRERERRAIARLPGAVGTDLEALRAWLARTIRAGGLDHCREALEAVLAERVAARLAISGPSPG